MLMGSNVVSGTLTTVYSITEHSFTYPPDNPLMESEFPITFSCLHRHMFIYYYEGYRF